MLTVLGFSEGGGEREGQRGDAKAKPVAFPPVTQLLNAQQHSTLKSGKLLVFACMCF